MMVAKAVCHCRSALFHSGCLDGRGVSSLDLAFRLMSERDARGCYVDVRERSRVRMHLVVMCKSIGGWREVSVFVVVM